MNSNFSDNLKKIRKDNNLSQEQLADQLGVSRQSVSKWESSQAYPEMDKVLQICNIFNLNIDELLNQDIKEIKETKESKNKINKYIDDFLGFITKTIDMFTSMTFKQKIRCLIEQFIIIIILITIGLIIGSIGYYILDLLIGAIPYQIYNVIFRIMEAIYSTIYIVFAFIIFIHIFKTRYLDYYIILKDDKKEIIEENIDEKNNINETLIKKRKEKIIIRDPKHSEYKFINGLLRCLLFIIKCLSMFIFLGFACTLIMTIMFAILCIYHISVHSLFIGLSLCCMSGIIVNILVLIGLYDFIFSKKFYAKKVFVSFLISLLICGIGCALTFISCMSLKPNKKTYENKDELIKEYKYNTDLQIDGIHNEYTFEVNNELKDSIQVKVNYNNDIYNIDFVESHNYIFIDYYSNLNNFITSYNQLKKDLKNNIVYDYQTILPQMTIITSEDNIKYMINKYTKNRVSNLMISENKYYLTLDMYESENTICNIKDGYYNDCVYIDNNDDIDINDFSYTGNKLKYDQNKYSCANNGDEKYYYCNLKELNEEY